MTPSTRTPPGRRPSRLEVYARTTQLGVVATIDGSEAADRRALIRTCIAAGVDVIELDSDAAGLAGVVADAAWSRGEAPRAVIGAGPVDTVGAIERLAEEGVRFIRTSGDSGNLARACNVAGVAYLPTCADVVGRTAGRATGAELIVVPLGQGINGAALEAALAPDPATVIVAPPAPPDPGEVEALAAAGAAAVRIPIRANGPVGEELQAALEQVVNSFRRGRGDPLFAGIEHTGLYPVGQATDLDITAWYVEAFGFPLRTLKTHFLGRGTDGRIEVMREPADAGCHLAVTVRDFDEAVDSLRSRGYALQEPVLGPTSRVVYLEDRDPAGNLVHLIWRP